VVFDALPHAFWYDSTLPEAIEANKMMADFFLRVSLAVHSHTAICLFYTSDYIAVSLLTISLSTDHRFVWN
jgi:hypothetical protein